MTRPIAYLEVDRPPLRGICLIVKGKHPHAELRLPPATATVTKFPRRPHPGALSEAIPLFFVARSRNGLWIAREAEGRSGGIFLFKRSALRFAQNNGGPHGCATMLLGGCLELDVKNRGNRLVAWLATVVRSLIALIPDHLPPLSKRRRILNGERS